MGEFTDAQLREISVPARIVLGGRSPIHNAAEVRDRLRRLGLDAEIADAAHDLGLLESVSLRDLIVPPAGQDRLS